jgi:hypothetical protein
MARLLPFGGFARLALSVLVIGAALVGATTASAGPAISTTTPMFFTGTNPCTGEFLTGTGNFHFLLSDNLSSSGRIQFHLEVSFSGIQATTFMGKKYVAIDQENQTDTFDFDGGAAHETVEHTFQLIRSGEDGTLLTGDDLFEHFLAHITANANGEVTVNDLTTDTRCR